MKRIMAIGVVGISFLHALEFGRAAEMFVQPVGASGTHTIVGREIRLAGGGQRVFFDIFLHGFAPDQLAAYQVAIQTVVSSDTGSTIGPAIQTCPSVNSAGHLVCATAFGDTGLGSPRCYEASPKGELRCEAGWMSKVRTDWAFYGHSSVSTVAIGSPLFRWACTTTDNSDLVTDEGQTFYAGSMAIDVPGDATGTFMLGFDATQSNLYRAIPTDFIQPLTLLAATIKMACANDDDCRDASLCTIDFCDEGVCVNEALSGCTGWKSIANCLTGPSAGIAPGCAAYDLDDDGHMDLWDVALLLR